MANSILEVEKVKENILPIRQGRNVDTVVLSQNETDPKAVEVSRRYFEDKLRTYEGCDIFGDVWQEYITWAEQYIPRSGNGFNYMNLLQRCIFSVHQYGKYRDDERVLGVWAKYANCCDHPSAAFSSMFSEKLFCGLASFFIHWASALESIGNKDGARDKLLLGMEMGAVPPQVLQDELCNLNMRCQFDYLKHSQVEGFQDVSSRQAFNQLVPQGEAHTAPFFRGGEFVVAHPVPFQEPLGVLQQQPAVFPQQHPAVFPQQHPAVFPQQHPAVFPQQHPVLQHQAAAFQQQPVPRQYPFQAVHSSSTFPVFHSQSVPLVPVTITGPSSYSAALTKINKENKQSPGKWQSAKGQSWMQAAASAASSGSEPEFRFFVDKSQPTTMSLQEGPNEEALSTMSLQEGPNEEALSVRTDTSSLQHAPVCKRDDKTLPMYSVENVTDGIEEYSFEEIHNAIYGDKKRRLQFARGERIMDSSDSEEMDSSDSEEMDSSDSEEMDSSGSEEMDIDFDDFLSEPDASDIMMGKQVTSDFVPQRQRPFSLVVGFGRTSDEPTSNQELVNAQQSGSSNDHTCVGVKESMRVSEWFHPNVQHSENLGLNILNIYHDKDASGAKELQTTPRGYMSSTGHHDENLQVCQSNVDLSVRPKTRSSHKKKFSFMGAAKSSDDNDYTLTMTTPPDTEHFFINTISASTPLAKRHLPLSYFSPLSSVGACRGDKDSQDKLLTEQLDKIISVCDSNDDEHQSALDTKPQGALSPEPAKELPCRSSLIPQFLSPILEASHEISSLSRKERKQKVNMTEELSHAEIAAPMMHISPPSLPSFWVKRDGFPLCCSARTAKGHCQCSFLIQRSFEQSLRDDKPHPITEKEKVYEDNHCQVLDNNSSSQDKPEDVSSPKYDQIVILKVLPIDPLRRKSTATFLENLDTPISYKKNFYDSKKSIKTIAVGEEFHVGNQCYLIQNLIGQGGYGKVYIATPLADSACCSSKATDDRDVALKASYKQNAWEFYVCGALQHKLAETPGIDVSESVMSCLACVSLDDGVALTTEYCKLGSLTDLVFAYKKNGERIPEILVMFLSYEVLVIISRMHECGFLHNDITIDNFLVRAIPSSADIKKNIGLRTTCLRLVDFGLAIDRSLFDPNVAFKTVIKIYREKNRDKEGGPFVFQNTSTKMFSDKLCDECSFIYEPDYFSAANVILTLLFTESVGVHLNKENKYEPNKKLKRYWKTQELWDPLLSLLLNLPLSLEIPDLQPYLAFIAQTLQNANLFVPLSTWNTNQQIYKSNKGK